MKTLQNVLYLQIQGAYARLEGETVKIEVEKSSILQVPLHHLEGIVLFGNVLVSPFLIHRCASDGRDIVWLSEHGRFQGRLSSATSGNVLLRQAQHQAASNPDTQVQIARRLIAGRFQNSRNFLLRLARESQDPEDRKFLQQAAKTHGQVIQSLPNITSIDALRGQEGFAARCYFEAFDRGIRRDRDIFQFEARSRRPPLNPMNSLLSLTYTLLTREYVAACESVGLDPQIGFLHALRPGRPALALDLMEELRSIFADRFVFKMINLGQIKADDFIERPGGAIYLNDSARKIFLTAYEKRKHEEITHPFLQKSVPWELVPHIQARLLARYLRGDLPHYPPFVPR